MTLDTNIASIFRDTGIQGHSQGWHSSHVGLRTPSITIDSIHDYVFVDTLVLLFKKLRRGRVPLGPLNEIIFISQAPLCQRRESTEASSHTVELIFGCRTECSNLLENETKPLKALLQR